MDVEDVAGKRLAAGRASQQQGELAVRPGMVREVVVDDEHIAPLLHEILRDARRRVGRYIGEPGRLVALGDDDHGVVHGALLLEAGHDLGDGRGALADRAVDAQHVLAFLVQDGVDRDRRLARLAVAKDQLPLAAADGNQGVDDHEPGLQWNGYGLAIHDGRCRPLDRPALVPGKRPLVVKGSAKRVDHAPQKALSHDNVGDPPRAFNLVSGAQILVVAE